MKYKVCHISTVHKVNDGRIFFKECISLYKSGFEVYYIVTNDKEEEIDGIKIIPLKEDKGRVSRLIRKSREAYRKAISIDADVYHFHDPELLIIGFLLKRKGKKVIYDSHENVPAQILNKEYLGNKFIRKIVSYIFNAFEKGISRRFDAVVTVTEDIKSKFTNKNTLVLKNYPILEMIQNAEPMNIETERPVIIYVGGLTEIRGIKELVEVVGKLDGLCDLWLLGTWDSKEYKDKCSGLYGWKYVKDFGYHPMYEVFRYMKCASIGCCTLYPVPNHIGSLPVKVFEYMACSLPVVMSNFKLWIENFREGAVFVDPNNIEEISEKIKMIIEDDNLRNELSYKGNEMTRKYYSWENESLKLLDLYNKILSKE
jgi:glycosyltransferase involved in cell wall biosynthesis